MPQPAVIVEWYGSYDTLEDVREANEEFANSHRQVLCMALGGEPSGSASSRFRFIISWQRTWPGVECSFPADDRLSDPGNQSFYVGWVASNKRDNADYARATRSTAEWALVQALRPELNNPPEPCPPGYDDRYCGSVCSWFYSTDDEEEKRDPPAGFPTVVTFNSYNDPPDDERVLRLPMVGCDD